MKFIASYAPTFFGYIISVLAMVTCDKESVLLQMKGEPEVSSTKRQNSSEPDHKPGGTVLKLVGMRND